MKNSAFKSLFKYDINIKNNKFLILIKRQTYVCVAFYKELFESLLIRDKKFFSSKFVNF